MLFLLRLLSRFWLKEIFCTVYDIRSVLSLFEVTSFQFHYRRLGKKENVCFKVSSSVHEAAAVR